MCAVFFINMDEIFANTGLVLLIGDPGFAWGMILKKMPMFNIFEY